MSNYNASPILTFGFHSAAHIKPLAARLMQLEP
jgi:hypothetical protein